MARTLSGDNNSASSQSLSFRTVYYYVLYLEHQCVTQTHCFQKPHFGYMYSVPFCTLDVADKFGTAISSTTTNILCFLITILGASCPNLNMYLVSIYHCWLDTLFTLTKCSPSYLSCRLFKAFSLYVLVLKRSICVCSHKG